MAETEQPAPAATGNGAGAPAAPAEPAPAPEDAKAAAAAELEALLAPPYDKETSEKVLAFFQKRAKNAEGFTYDARGNLETKEGAAVGKRRKAEPAGVINLKRHLPLEPKDRTLLEENRLDTIAAIEEEYEAAREELRNAWAEYAVSGSMRPVLAANQRVAELDMRRNSARSAVRNMVHLENMPTKRLLFNSPYEKRKLFSPADLKLFRESDEDQIIPRLVYADLPAEQEFGKYVVDEAVPEAVAAAQAEAAGGEPAGDMTFRQRLKDGRMARIFYDDKAGVNGFLTPFMDLEFTLDDTRYAFPLQAYEAERMRELGKATLREALLKTRSARTVRLMVQKIEGNPADPRGLWKRILTAVYQQHPELKPRLLETGTDSLVYADPRPGPSGVGLAEKDSGVLDGSKWKGENAVGLALETIRTELREETLAEAPADDAPAEAVITEEEQKAAKVGAIINNARRAGPGA